MSFLGVRRDFSNWVKTRIKQYGFIENQDFILIRQNGRIKGKGGDRRSKEYHLTLDMAKELSMVERTDRGREARRYFIECEQIAKGKVKQLKPNTIPDRPTLPPVNKDLLFKYSYDGLTRIETRHEEMQIIQKYLSEPEIELVCILRSLGSQRRSQAFKLVYRLYKIKHKVQLKMGHRPDLSEREAINYVVDRSIGMA